MKKTVIFLLAAITMLASCSGKLPNASITGATFGDYVPYGMMIVGGLFLVYTGVDQLINGKAYNAKTLNPAVKRFVFGVLGAILLVMGYVIYAS